MGVKHITSKDFSKVAKQHEFFIWHFYSNDAKMLGIYPYEKSYFPMHPLKDIVDLIKFPYFESDIKKEYDFVMNLDDKFMRTIVGKKNLLNPVIIGFNRTKVMGSTYDSCYCPEGIIDLVGRTNPDFLVNLT